MKRFSLFLVCTLAGSPLLAAKPRSGLLSPVFDGKLSGARFIGLGEIGAAAAGGPESPVWNPAALHDLTGPVFSIDFDVARQSKIKEEILVGDIPMRGRKLTYLGFAAKDTAFFYRPLANFNKRTVTNTASPEFDFIEENLKIQQIGFAAASEGEEGAVLGVNVTYLNAHRSLAIAETGQPPQIDFADGHGFTLDMGFQRKWEFGSFGMSFFNIPGILYWNNYKADQLPVIMKLGTAFYPVPVMGFLVEYDKKYYRGGLSKPDATHMGLELTLAPWLQIRGGTYGEDLSDSEKTNYAGGFSMASPRGGYQMDFALRTYRFNNERVYNYFLSVLLPLPQGSVEEASPGYNTRSWDMPNR